MRKFCHELLDSEHGTAITRCRDEDEFNARPRRTREDQADDSACSSNREVTVILRDLDGNLREYSHFGIMIRDILDSPGDHNMYHVAHELMNDPGCPSITKMEGTPHYKKQREPMLEDHRMKFGLRRGGICAGCGFYFDSDRNLATDHRIPSSKGGTDGRENLQFLCTKCNSSKGNKTPEEWEAWKEENRADEWEREQWRKAELMKGNLDAAVQKIQYSEDVVPADDDDGGEADGSGFIRSTAMIVEKLGLVGKSIVYANDESVGATINSVKGCRIYVIFGAEEVALSRASHAAYKKWSGNDQSGQWNVAGAWKIDDPGSPHHGKTLQELRTNGTNRRERPKYAQERHMHNRARRPRLIRNPLLETARMTRADLDAGYERERKSRIRNLASEFMRGVIRHGNQSRNFFFGPDIIEYKTILQGNREVYVFARRSTMEFEDGFYPKVTIWPHVVTSSIAEDRETADLVIEHLRGMRGMRDIGSLHGMLGDHDFDFVLEIKDKEEDRG